MNQPPDSPRPLRRAVFSSIRWRLPLFVSLFTAIVFAGFLGVTYLEADSALLQLAGERAEGAAQQVADLLGSQLRAQVSQIKAVAARRDLVQFLTGETPDARTKTVAALWTLVGSSNDVSELWSVSRGRIFRFASTTAVNASYPQSQPTGTGVTFDAVNGTIVATSAEPVRSRDATKAILGYVVTRHPVSSSDSDALNSLIGVGARIEIGGSASQWTDLANIVPGPPVSLSSLDFRQYRAESGEARLGALRPVPGTPWLVWVSFPRAIVTTQARAFVRAMSLIAALFVLAIGVVSAVATAPIVHPLSALTKASEAVAAGDFDFHVPARGLDEVGRLGRAFNRMISDLRESRERLVERAQHATCLADVSSALTAGGPLPAMLGRCASALVEHLSLAHVAVWTKSPNGPWLDRMGSAGSTKPFGREYDRVPLESLEIGLIARNNASIVTNDVVNEPALRARMWSDATNLVAFAGHPLVVNGQLVGVLAAAASGPLNERSQDTLALTGRTIAVGIARWQLEDSRAQLAGILDGAADFVTIGQPDGPPFYINRAARRALEIGDNDQVQALSDFRTPKFRSYFTAVVLPEIDRRGSWTGESEYVSKSGRRIPVSQITVGHRDPKGQLLYLSTIARDISDQKRAESALRESEARFRNIAETITEVFWIADGDLSRVSYVSPGYERVWGRKRANLYRQPQSVFDAVHPDDRVRVLATVNIQAEGKSFEHEYRIIRPDGDVRWVWNRGFPVRDYTGRITQYVGAAQDITERKQAEGRLRLLALAVESTNEMVSVTDENDRYTFVNRAFTETYGYSEDEVLGQTPAMLEPGEKPSELYEEIGRETRRGGWEGEVSLRCKDGTQIVVNLHTSLLRDEGGKTVGLLRVARDITPKLLLEDQLRQAQKMEAIGQLAGGIAHDFNNLLTAILGYSALLSDSFPNDDPRRNDVDQIRYAANRATSLTKQLLAFSRKQILAPQTLRLGDVVRDLVPMLQRLLGETIDLKTIVADLGLIKADTSQLEQVLVNLSVNARDAMPNGGKLTIETSDARLDDAYARQHAGVNAGSFVMLTVSDSGVGMDAATQKRVFEPFFTTKPPGVGTGLGLATVHGIISQSGGHIWLYSEVGRGTTFKVYLPRTDAAAEEAAAPADELPKLEGDESILLVEDEEVVREFVQRILTRHGYAIHTMPNPAQAMEFAESYSGQVDLILTDVVLPKMNGHDLSIRLLKHFPDASVMFMSGYTDDAIVRHGVLEPGTWFLQKPFTSEALLAKVREVLNARQPSHVSSRSA